EADQGGQALGDRRGLAAGNPGLTNRPASTQDGGRDQSRRAGIRPGRGASDRDLRPVVPGRRSPRGAESGTRTRTPFRTMVFETIASTIPPSRRTVVPVNLTG